MIVATTGDVPAFVAVNVGIFPLPVAANLCLYHYWSSYRSLLLPY